MQDNVVLDVEIGSPVADFCCTLEVENLNDRILVNIVQHDMLLVFLDECFVGR